MATLCEYYHQMIYIEINSVASSIGSKSQSVKLNQTSVHLLYIVISSININ